MAVERSTGVEPVAVVIDSAMNLVAIGSDVLVVDVVVMIEVCKGNGWR